jgi:hypothetical protein
MAWYSIDPIFYTQRPAGVSTDDVSKFDQKIFSEELYPLTDIAQAVSSYQYFRFNLLSIWKRTLQ